MILLVAAPGSTRSALISCLEHEGLSARVCATYEEARAAYAKIPQFQLVIGEYRIAAERAETFMADLARQAAAIPIVVLSAPLKAEADLLRRGALVVLAPGYSPLSLALQSANLVRFAARKEPPRVLAKRAVNAFEFGGALVVPEQRTLNVKRGNKSAGAMVPLTRLEVRLLQTFHASPGAVLDYEFLFHAVWDRDYQGDSAVLREAVSALRKRFRRLGLDLDQCVTSAYGEGFRYDPV